MRFAGPTMERNLVATAREVPLDAVTAASGTSTPQLVGQQVGAATGDEPFYTQWWFLAGSVAALAGAGYVLYRRRQKQLRRK